MEHVARIPAPLDPLKRRVVALEVERVPRNAGRIPLRISEVDVGVVDHRAVADVTRYRNAARVREQVPIERADPRDRSGFVIRVAPASRARCRQDRVSLRRRRRVRCHSVDLSAIRGEAKHPTGDIVISPSQVLVRSFDLAIGKALAEECVLALEERTTPNRREQLGERIQREIQPGGSLETPCVRRTDATV